MQKKEMNEEIELLKGARSLAWSHLIVFLLGLVFGITLTFSVLAALFFVDAFVNSATPLPTKIAVIILLFSLYIIGWAVISIILWAKDIRLINDIIKAGKSNNHKEFHRLKSIEEDFSHKYFSGKSIVSTLPIIGKLFNRCF